MNSTNSTANVSEEPTNAVPAWANGVDPKIVARVVKDHGFVQGLEVKVDVINVAPNGERVLAEFVRVTVGKIAYLKSSYKEYVDCFWEVSIHPEDLKFVEKEGLSQEEPNPCIHGISYVFNNGELTSSYRGYLASTKLWTN